MKIIILYNNKTCVGAKIAFVNTYFNLYVGTKKASAITVTAYDKML